MNDSTATTKEVDDKLIVNDDGCKKLPSSSSTTTISAAAAASSTAAAKISTTTIRDVNNDHDNDNNMMNPIMMINRNKNRLKDNNRNQRKTIKMLEQVEKSSKLIMFEQQNRRLETEIDEMKELIFSMKHSINILEKIRRTSREYIQYMRLLFFACVKNNSNEINKLHKIIAEIDHDLDNWDQKYESITLFQTNSGNDEKIRSLFTLGSSVGGNSSSSSSSINSKQQRPKQSINLKRRKLNNFNINIHSDERLNMKRNSMKNIINEQAQNFKQQQTRFPSTSNTMINDKFWLNDLNQKFRTKSSKMMMMPEDDDYDYDDDDDEWT